MYTIKLDNECLYYPGDADAVLIDPVLSLEVGMAGSLTFTCPPANPLYNAFENRKSMVSVFEDNAEIFYGEVRSQTVDFQKNHCRQLKAAPIFLKRKTVFCEGIFA